MITMEQVFIIRDNVERDLITQVGPHPDNPLYIKITEFHEDGDILDSLSMSKERAKKVAEAILALTETR